MSDWHTKRPRDLRLDACDLSSCQWSHPYKSDNDYKSCNNDVEDFLQKGYDKSCVAGSTKSFSKCLLSSAFKLSDVDCFHLNIVTSESTNTIRDDVWFANDPLGSQHYVAPVRCPIGEDLIEVHIIPGHHPHTTSLSLTNNCTNTEVANIPAGTYTKDDQAYLEKLCVPPGGEYLFWIGGHKSYNLLYNGVSLASGGEFDAEENIIFGQCEAAEEIGCVGTSKPYDIDYRGQLSKTVSGRTCQNWDSQIPHTHTRTPEGYPNSGLDKNYCRNPDGAPPGAWCYTMDENKRWEDCDVPKCDETIRKARNLKWDYTNAK